MGSLLSFLVNPGERKCVFPQTADEVAPSEAGRRGGVGGAGGNWGKGSQEKAAEVVNEMFVLI